MAETRQLTRNEQTGSSSSVCELKIERHSINPRDLGPPVPHERLFVWRALDGACFRARGAIHIAARPKRAVHVVGPRLPGFPLWFGGHAFDGERPADGPWSGWPAAEWWIPAVVEKWEPESTRRAFVQRIHGQEPVEQAARAESAVESPGWACTPCVLETRALFESRVMAAQRALSPAFAKVVLARAVSLGRRSIDLEKLERSLGDVAPRATRYRVTLPGRGCFVGASPELVARTRPGRIETVALAGTRRHQNTMIQELWNDPKELHEHDLVVRGVTSALAELCPASVHVGELHERRAGQVIHLEAQITGELKSDATLACAIKCIHPSAALAGAPRTLALEYLRQNEAFSRGWYAGVVGFCDAQGHGEAVAALRGALVRDGETFAFAGCGIVPDSVPAAEWEETQAKLETARAAVARALLPESRAAELSLESAP